MKLNLTKTYAHEAGYREHVKIDIQNFISLLNRLLLSKNREVGIHIRVFDADEEASYEYSRGFDNIERVFLGFGIKKIDRLSNDA